VPWLFFHLLTDLLRTVIGQSSQFVRRALYNFDPRDDTVLEIINSFYDE